MRLPTRLALLLALVPALAPGQTSTLSLTEPFRSTNLPPTSAALADEATATVVNPAGLSAVGAAQLFYVHERSLARDQVDDGLYLAGSLPGLGAGLSVDWLRSPSLASYRKTGLGLSLGSRHFALGAAFNFFSSDEDPTLDKMSSIDLGLLIRPADFLSVGAVVRNLDQRTLFDLTFGRRYDVAVGLRPFGERLTLAVDYLFTEAGGVGAGRLAYTLQARVVKGLQLSAGFSHDLHALEPQFQLAATFDTEHLGVAYALGSSPGGFDHVLAVRASVQRYPSFAPSGKVALIDLNDRLAHGGTLSALGLGNVEDPYLRLIRFLDQATRDEELKGAVFKIEDLRGLGLARAEELRQALARMRGAGKKVIALMLAGGDSDYLVASAADKIYAAPQSVFMINGFTAEPTFFGGTMDKLGVHWDVARVGAYKTATDPLTRTGLSPEERETLEAILAADVKAFQAAADQGRKLSPEKVQAIWAEGMLPPTRARELGLVDDIVTQEKLNEQLELMLPEASYDPSYSPGGRREQRWGGRKRIALIPVLGAISGGKSRQGPFGTSDIAGAETVLKALRRAEEDPRVAAIVLRVDSPGGDGLASDLIYRAVLETKKTKPVVASMGDYAASGGYYAAMGADEVFASPTTITGSIGVFIVKPAVEGLASRLGITHEAVKTGPLADLLDEFRPWTPEQRAAVQKWVDAFYDDFITEVARSRRLSREQVDAIARGRAWSGADAKARGLVDTLGGLMDAIGSARKRAGISGEDVDLEVYGEAGGLVFGSDGEADALVERALVGLFGEARPRDGLPPQLAALAAELGIQAELLRDPGVKAMMPFTLKIE